MLKALCMKQKKELSENDEATQNHVINPFPQGCTQAFKFYVLDLVTEANVRLIADNPHRDTC